MNEQMIERMNEEMIKHEINTCDATIDALECFADGLISEIGDGETAEHIKSELKTSVSYYRGLMFKLHSKLANLPDKGNYKVEPVLLVTSQSIIDKRRSQMRAV